jgi:hypothetical protein
MTTLSITTPCHNVKCRAECRDSFIIMLCVIILSAIMLWVVILSVVMLSVIMLNVVAPLKMVVRLS